MNLAERFVSLVTERSALVVVVMLLLSVGMGAGMTFLDDEAGLDQFQFDSEEGDALEEIEENFEVEEDETTTVQIVLRSDNDDVLTRESFISTLELQEEIRADDDINQTLAEEDTFADLASVVATAAMQEERAEELEAEQEELEEESDELEAESDALEEESDELEAESEELEAEQETLENESAVLEADQEELNETASLLTDGLNETQELEQQFIELNASLEQGEISQQAYEAEAEEISEQLDDIEAEAAERLDDESLAAYEGLRDDVRTITGEIAAVERQYQMGELNEAERDSQMGALEDDLTAVYEDIENVVLADEIADLGERGEELQERGDELEEWGEELEERGDELEVWGEELEERGDELEVWGEELEERGEATEELDPTLAEQREKLESMSDDEVEDVVSTVLGEDGAREALVFVPTDYDRSSTTTDARQLFVTQTTEEEIVDGEAPPDIERTQLAMADIVDERFGDEAFLFGAGIISDEIDRSMADSMAIVLPLALLFVLVVLSIAYRDPLDIILGMFGIGLVLVWTFGFMGWAGIAFNQIMIAVPVLLVGLSIDYAIHVFMRHREQRADGRDGTRPSMGIVLLGLGAALVWVTITAVLGFLSNLVSPVAPIQEFGLVSAFGIAATLLIFGTFVPAAKVGLDSFFEARGWDRRKRAFGTGGGAFTRILSGGQRAAKRMPVVVIVIALLITAGGAFGAAQVDTTFEEEDFIADDPPDWMKSLPGGFAPGEYNVKENLEFVNERFLRQDSQTQVLVREDITTDDTLTDIGNAEDIAADQDVIVTLSDGEPDIQSSLSVMEEVAAENESFAETFEAADTTGDDVPDENITAVYDAFFEAAPDRASDVIYRTDDGSYESTRMILSIQGDATAGEATDATREVAASLDRADRPAIATGQLVVFNVIEDELFNTVLESLLITVITVFAFLMLAYRFVHGSAILGAVTLTPIVLSVAWILGTMYLLGIPFNVMTGTITSLTIGLGVAYNIHMSERYRLELRRGHDIWEALERGVTGTGGALLGSAATTAGGFGVLALAILPPLQQFGIITGLTIIYAFLGSVFVLPSFLVLWTRYLGPAERFPDDSDETPRSPPGGGRPTGETGIQESPVSNGGPATITEYEPPTSGAPAARWRPSMGTERTVPAEPTRSVEPAALEPGDTYTATLAVPLTPGLTVLEEDLPGTIEGVDSFGPAPISVDRSDGTVEIQWDPDAETVATVEITGQLADSAETATFSGTVSTAERETAIGGDDSRNVLPTTSSETPDRQ